MAQLSTMVQHVDSIIIWVDTIITWVEAIEKREFCKRKGEN